MQTTTELVELAKTGDCDAIGALVDRYERAAVVIAWTILGDFHLAQDVAQDCFVVAFRQLSQLRSSEAFGGWLMTSVRRKAIKLKARAGDETVDFPLSELPDRDSDWVFVLEEILPMLRELPEQEFQVINFRYLNGFSVKEIAIETGRPIGTVTKQLSRAVRRLRTMVNEVEL
ncbi:MAG: sigma-70 family RNA polymerase sigma factor [Planctomycetes bacterium]|nr:sigma-70 family RNA polymerase sigma factor [Planctomycetota bacterium]MCH9723652.1 sigma-70 family RNA polymerase sigma factor [Planctomycetota bacterium]MCH9778470.1 sigma-70 family RNA polymerase sigma factor [Planctomycetota bacterium]MCH9791461.1 sigma-70 family RNA polymerase sigma factor [Planctomycetota bacterium]